MWSKLDSDLVGIARKCELNWNTVLSILLSRRTKSKELCFLRKWRQHTLKDSLLENYEISLRLKSDSHSTGKDHVYPIGFYAISYIQEHIRSWHTWLAQKETTSCTRVYVQDWHWIGYILNSNLCNLILVHWFLRGYFYYVQDIPLSWVGDLST